MRQIFLTLISVFSISAVASELPDNTVGELVKDETLTNELLFQWTNDCFAGDS
jgi:hypothetical protein